MLEKITAQNLDKAIEVASKIFPYEVHDGKLSFEDDAYRESIQQNDPRFAYYLATIPSPFDVENILVGITGHYTEKKSALMGCGEEIWLGWFGVLPEYRGFGYGQRILRDTSIVVSQFGYKEMSIYSGQREEERNAHKLYEANGFVKIGDGVVNHEPVFFFKGPVPVGR